MKSYMSFCLVLLILILQISCEKEGNIASSSLAVNQSENLSISSELEWNNSGLNVAAGEEYQIVSTGTWTDLNTTCDANGYSDSTLNTFNHLKRDTNGLWFELVVAIDTTNFYVLGADTAIVFNQSGELSFFANDALGFYTNNSGTISTHIKRLQ